MAYKIFTHSQCSFPDCVYVLTTCGNVCNANLHIQQFSGFAEKMIYGKSQTAHSGFPDFQINAISTNLQVCKLVDWQKCQKFCKYERQRIPHLLVGHIGTFYYIDYQGAMHKEQKPCYYMNWLCEASHTYVYRHVRKGGGAYCDTHISYVILEFLHQ